MTKYVHFCQVNNSLHFDSSALKSFDKFNFNCVHVSLYELKCVC